MSKTEENLKTAFAGESEARNKYTYFAKIATNQGYHYIAKIFEETAENEREHAKQEFKRLNGIGDTIANLKAAIDGENYETTQMYPQFAKEAKEEGNDDATKLFTEIGEVEERHRERFKKLLELVESGMVWKRNEPIEWKCSKCGYKHTGIEPPQECPACKHAKEYYEPSDLSLIPPRAPENE